MPSNDTKPYPELTCRCETSDRPIPEQHARFAATLARTALARQGAIRDREELLRLWRVFIDAVEAECRGIPETRLSSLQWTGSSLMLRDRVARYEFPPTTSDFSACIDDAISLLDIAYCSSCEERSFYSSLAAELPIDPIPF